VTTVQSIRAPARVNLMGDHTDYQDGLCLPVAIDREVVAAVAARGDGRVVARSDLAGGVVNIAADGRDDPSTITPSWGRYLAGVVRALAHENGDPIGADIAFTSTVPAGSGLSSSAAFTVAAALALHTIADRPVDRIAVARACQQAEALAAGVPCGLLDPMAALFGQRDHAMLLDCRTLTVDPVALPSELAVLVVHCGAPRTLAGSEYATRRRQCEHAAARIGVETLRDATPVDVRDDPRARHVVSENKRVVAFRDALVAADHAAIGALMAASHASLRDDFEVSTPLLDALVDSLLAAGAIGARLTGAGFGGCAVAMARESEFEAVARDATAAYASRTGVEPMAFRCRAVDGAGRLPSAAK